MKREFDDKKAKELRIQVGARLKESRKTVGMTQSDAAKRLYMTQQQYSRFENGIFELNYEQIVFLCKLYDISPNFLFGFEEF